MALKLGHKFALPHSNKGALTELLETVQTGYDKVFSLLSPIEYRNWKNWIERLKKRVSRMKEEKQTMHTRLILRGIQDLKSMDVVIKQADKNLGIVPIACQVYRWLRSKHLESSSFKKVSEFPHGQVYMRLRNILKLQCEVPSLTKGSWLDHALKAKDPCHFYVIPKLHKPKLSTRPITANHSYMLAPLSKKLAEVLQIKVNATEDIARDSMMVMQQLDELYFDEPIEFVTYDVENMYPTINIKEAIKTLHDEVPEMRNNCGFWTKVLQLIMYNNYVQAGSDIYRQEKGTATGTQVAPPFANLFLYFKFKKLLKNPRILYQSRYIDDGLLIVKMNTSAKAIVKLLEKVSGHRLTFECSPYKATYLDITVYKGIRYQRMHMLDTKVFFKETNKFLYLPPNSNHPTFQKKAVIKGEAIRCLRISSDKAHWLEAMNTIFKGLLKRGYKARLIKQEWRKVRYEHRQKFLMESTKRTKPEGKMILTKYHPNLRRSWHTLINKNPLRSNVFNIGRLGRLNNKQRRIFDIWPPILVYKDFVRIGNKVISAKEQVPTDNPGQEQIEH